MMKIKKLFKYINVLTLAVLLLGTVTIASAFPVTLDVRPIDSSVMAGQTATYQVDLINPGSEDEALISITVVDSSLPDVIYTFSPTTGTIGAGTTMTIDLTAFVPDGKPAGSYDFDVKAVVSSDLPGGTVIEENEYLDVILDVEIPEFSTIAMPIISVLGLMFIMKRRKEKS